MNVESDTHLKQFVIGNYQLINLPIEELSQLLCHLTETETRQNLIDKEYSILVGSLNKKRNDRLIRGRKSKKEKPIRQDATNNVNTQKISNRGSNRRFLATKTKPSKRELRTHERRKKLQFLMRKNRAKGAQSVLNDDYGEEQMPFPHERLFEYWRQVFSW